MLLPGWAGLKHLQLRSAARIAELSRLIGDTAPLPALCALSAASLPTAVILRHPDPAGRQPVSYSLKEVQLGGQSPAHAVQDLQVVP